MANKLPHWLQQFQEFWSVLSGSKRLILLLVTTGVLAAVLVLAFLSSRERYSYLYTDLATEDAAAIVEKLKELKAQHRLTADGTSIEVLDNQVHSLRLQLASSGLPRGGGVGFEIFDQSSLGATEFEQQVKLRRALEGELARSIGSLEGVRAARVHLVMPERRLFASKSEAASASIVVRLTNGVDFGRREVAGVVHLVATAVPGLTHDRVSVVSTDGLTLHRPDPGAGGGMSDARAEQSRDVGQQLEHHVRTLLERVTGSGAVDVRVAVNLDPASSERTEEHYEPTRTVLRSEHKTEEAVGREGATVAGVPGAQENLPNIAPAVPAQEQATNGDVLRHTHTRNWEVDRVTEKTQRPAGAIARLSVAVLVDGTYEEKDGTSIYTPRDPEQIRQLDGVVKGAVGYDERRGDTVLVEAARFARVDISAPEDAAGLPFWERYLPHAAAAVAALFILIVFGMAVRHRRRLRHTIVAVEQNLRQQELVRIEAEDRHRQDEERALLEQEQAAGLLEGINPDDVLLRRQEALEIASKDPATTAVVLKSWLNQEPEPSV